MTARVVGQPKDCPTIERILQLARWAPSGDNTQPWRFEITDDHTLVVHGSDTRDWCVYDLEGHASQVAVGALLETIAIAASTEGLTADIRRRAPTLETAPIIDVKFTDVAGLPKDPLADFITKRVTQRRSLLRRSLEGSAKRQLEQCLPPGYGVVWIEATQEKRQMARILFRSARIRLTIPEAYRVHRDVIEWNTRYSEDKIPDQAVGLDLLTLRLMRWAMKDWARVRFLNRYLAGTLLPRLQLDYLPAINCAAHFALVAEREPRGIDDFLSAGRALQRFWLSVTSAGLQFQPEMTPVIFAGYARKQIPFSTNAAALKDAMALRRQLETVFGEASARRTVFAGRVGYGRAPVSRSLRLPLSSLLVE